MTTRQSIGPAIKAIRLARGLTQTDIAQACGFTPSMLSQIEAGRRRAPAEKLRLIADLLSVPVDAISYLPDA